MMEKEFVSAEERALNELSHLYRSYGYRQFKMSRFEEYDLYVRNKSFLVSDQVITFTDTNGRLMALKPDVTLSIVKSIENKAPGLVQRRYYHENVYRVSETTHAYKEIMQAGLECIGDVDDYAISEVLLLAMRSLLTLNEDCVLDVSDLGVLSLAIDGMGLAPEYRQSVLRCVGEKNLHGVEEICEAAGVAKEKQLPLKALMSTYGAPDEVFDRLHKLLPQPELQARLRRLASILSLVPSKKLRVDFSVVNDMSYYNGIVFKGFISGIHQSILSGGQYDLLLQKAGKDSSAIGFAVYMDLLEELLAPQDPYDVDVLLLYDEKTDYNDLLRTVQELTASGKSVSAQRSLPEKLKYREKLSMKRGANE